MLNLIGIEWRKWAPRPVMWLPLAGISALIVLYAAYELVADIALDYGFIARATTGALGLPALLTALIVPASITAYEWQHGTITNIRVRPVRRMPLLLAKGSFAFLYGVALVVLVAVVAWGAALLSGKASGVTYGGELLFTSLEMQRVYAVASAQYLLQLSAVTAYGLAMGVLFRTTGASITAAIAGWLVLDLAKYPLGIEEYVVFTYWDSVWMPFVEQADGWEPAQQSIMISLTVACVWWGASMVVAYMALLRSER